MLKPISPSSPGSAAMWSTADVSGADVAAYWRDLVCETFVEVGIQPIGDSGFGGRVRHTDIDGVGSSTVS
ncbi:hypothetical protein AB0C34_29950 [Nocardia sp. NPDC049220]|uniref:hypothetical protein n=1 Tax=Nocardia sp. NPDC049220 TaxID=3155273 RepID=UPI0033C86F34